MNDLLKKSFSGAGDVEYGGDVEMGVDNLLAFYEEISAIKNDMESMRQLLVKLQDAREESKNVHNADTMKVLRARMDEDVAQVSKAARSIQGTLERLDKANAASRLTNGCEKGTVTDRSRQTITNSLRHKLKDYMEEFGSLRTKILAEYRESIERRYFTVTGEKPDEDTLESMIETGESENFLQKAIEEQGRGQVMEAIREIQERHDGVKEIEKNLLELQQIFLDMAVLVEEQGEQFNLIATQVQLAHDYVESATNQIVKADEYRRNTRKWICIAIILLTMATVIVVLPIVLTLD